MTELEQRILDAAMIATAAFLLNYKGDLIGDDNNMFYMPFSTPDIFHGVAEYDLTTERIVQIKYSKEYIAFGPPPGVGLEPIGAH